MYNNEFIINSDLNTIYSVFKIKKYNNGLYKGLTTAEAEAKLILDINKEPYDIWKSFLKKMLNDLMNLSNVFIIIITILLIIIDSIDKEETEHTLVIIFTVLVIITHIFINVWNNKKLKKALEYKIKKNKTKVYRDSIFTKIPTKKIVQGDIIELRAGETAWHDMRILESDKCAVNDVILTGDKKIKIKRSEKCTGPYEKAINMIFKGSIICNGWCKCVVIGVGKSTVLEKKKSVVIQKKVVSGVYEDFNALLQILLGVSTIVVGIYLVGIIPYSEWDITNVLKIIVNIYLTIVPENIFGLIDLLLYLAVIKLHNKKVEIREVKALEILEEIDMLVLERNVVTNSENQICKMISNGTKIFKVSKILEKGTRKEKKYFKSIVKICMLFKNAKKNKERKIEIKKKNKKNKNEISKKKTIKIENNKNEQLTKKYKSKILNNLLKKEREVENTEIKKYISFFVDLNKHIINKSSDIKNNCNNISNIGKSCNKINNYLVEVGLNKGVIVDKEKYSELFVIGNYKEIIKLSNKWIINGKKNQLKNSKKKNIIFLSQEIEKQGYKIIGIARKKLKKNVKNAVVNKLEFIAYMCFRDAVLNDSPKIIKKIIEEGITVCIICDKNQERMKEIDIIIKDVINKLAVDNKNNKTNIDSEMEFTNTSEINIINAKSDNFIQEIQNCKSKFFYVSNADEKSRIKLVKLLAKKYFKIGYFGFSKKDFRAIGKTDLSIFYRNTANASQFLSKIVLNKNNINGLLQCLDESKLFLINMRKAISYIMGHITPQFIALICFIIFRSPIALKAFLVFLRTYLVEFIPAIFLAYEKMEINTLDIKPKIFPQYGQIGLISFYVNSLRRITAPHGIYSFSIIFRSLFLNGLIISIGSLLSFYLAIIHFQIPINYCFFTKDYFTINSNSIITPTTIITAEEQLLILYKAQSTFELGLMICQFFHLLICRRRPNYFFHDFFSNCKPLLFSILGIVITLCIMCNTWFDKIILISRPVFSALYTSIIAGILIVVLDTIIKYRKNMRNLN